MMTGLPYQLVRKHEEVEKEGDTLGSYELVKLIGEGSMGRVFLARHARLGRQVALKVLRREHLRNSNLIQRFLQEARSVNQINHEHIVEVFDFVEELDSSGPGRVYCVMELLVGDNLSDLQRREPLSIARSLHLSRQVCEALEAAHQLGVVHRDIKPDNIFVTERNGALDYVKVLDFGVAKLTAPLGEEKASGTLEGTIVGTPSYMSPEQASGLGADHRADIYGVGVVLYEMLTGRPPFESTAFGQLVVQIITQAPPPLPSATASGERIPAELKALVMSCLDKEPRRRPQSMQSLGEALAQISSGGAWSRRPFRRAWPLVVGSVAAALAILMLLQSPILRKAPWLSAVQSSPGATASASSPSRSGPTISDQTWVVDQSAQATHEVPASVPSFEAGAAQVSDLRIAPARSVSASPTAAKRPKRMDRDGIVDPFAPN